MASPPLHITMDYEKEPLLQGSTGTQPVILPVYAAPDRAERRAARRRKCFKHLAIFLFIFAIWKLHTLRSVYWRGGYGHGDCGHHRNGYSGLAEWGWPDNGHELELDDGKDFPWPPELTIDTCAEWPHPPDDSEHGRLRHPHGNQGHPRSTVSTFNLPVSSDVLFLFARGPWSAGKVNILQGDDDQNDDVVVNITTKWYGPRALLDSVQVCKVKREEGQNGIGILSVRDRHPRHRHHHRVEFTVDVILPASKSADDALAIKDFRASMPIFTYNLADLAESVRFDSISLRGSVSSVVSESLAASRADFTSHVGSITGKFSTSSSLKLITDNGHIAANITLSNDAKSDEWTEVELRTSNAAIRSNISLVATSSDTGGQFRVKSTTGTGSTNIDLPSAPSETPLDMAGHGSSGAFDVALHETYDGAFSGSTSGVDQSHSPGAGRKNEKRNERGIFGRYPEGM
ncbi:hypothetical protein MPER_10444 [Moniliophthora perniciosa FA553]|nr:hypothetical protein MPER_10444 [Moniliophthora perniciosa FA553]